MKFLVGWTRSGLPLVRNDLMESKVYKIRRTLRVNYELIFGIYVWQSILSEDGCEDIFKEGLGPHLPNPQQLNPKLEPYDDKTKGGFWCFVEPEALEILAMEGYTAGDVEKDGQFKWQKHISKSPFTDRDKGLILVRDFHYAHMVFGADGLALPIAQRFDYISSGVDNENYDLKLAYETLKTHPDVVDLELVNIPYYNTTKKRTKALEFTWRPSAEDYRQVAMMKCSWDRRDQIMSLLGLKRK